MKKIISIMFICLLAFVAFACGEPKYSLSINDADKNVALVEGDEKVVVPTVAGGATLVWSSSAPAVASVAEGVITALKEGTAVITVSLKEDETLKVEINVTVSKKEVIVETKEYTVTFSDGVASQKVKEGEKATKPADPTKEGFIFKGWFVGETAYDFNSAVTGNITLTAKWEEEEPEVILVESIDIEREKETFNVGESEQLVLDVWPYEAKQELEWTITPAECAMVTEDGTFVALKGSTEIVKVRAEATDGSGVFAEYSVRIFNDIEEMEIKGSALLSINSTVKYELNIITEMTQSEIAWSSSDTTVLTVNGGNVTAVGIGKATITATSLDSTGTTASFEIEVIGASVYLNGTEYTSFDKAMEVAVEGDVIELGDGIYSTELKVTKNNITVKGPNAGRNPNYSTRLDEAKVTGTIVLAEGVKGFTLDGVEFTETGGLKTGYNCEDITIKNCYAHDTNTGVAAWTQTRNYDLDCVLSFVGNNTDSKDIKNLVIENNLFENVEETCILIGRALNVTVQNNVFHNFGRDAIRAEGGYNYGLWSFIGNEIYNDELGANNGIFLQSVSGTLEAVPVQEIYLANNTFKNIGQAETENTYNCAFGFNTYQEKGLKCKVEFNTFENCVNLFSMRNNGQAEPFVFESVIENNVFKGVPAGVYHRNNRPGSSDTATTNPPLTVMDKNLYLDAEGNVITDLTQYADKFQDLANAPKDNYATKADYEAVLKEALDYKVSKYVNPAWADLEAGASVEVDGFTWVIGTNAFGSLVKALEGAVEGDVIKLAAGEYAEAATISVSNLTFTASLSEREAINISAILTIASGVNNTKFENLRFTGKGQIFGDSLEGAECNQDGIIVDNCVIDGSTVDASQGTVFTKGAAKNIVFTNNNVINCKSARVVRSGGTLVGLVVSNNYFEDGGQTFDWLRADAAISGDVLIQNNVVKGSQQSFIMFMFHGNANFVITDNKIYDMKCVAIDIRTSNGVACTSTFNVIHNLLDNTNIDPSGVWNPVRFRFNDYTEETLVTNVNYNIYIHWGDMFLEDASNSTLGWANMDKNYFDGLGADDLTAANFENIAKSWADPFASIADLEVAYKAYLESLPEVETPEVEETPEVPAA